MRGDLTLVGGGAKAAAGRHIVPQFGEIRRMLVELASDFALPGTNVYEIGCETESVFPALHERCSRDIRFICADESDALLTRRRESTASLSPARQIDCIKIDISQGLVLRNASVVLMVLSLGLVHPLRRAARIADVHHGLIESGSLLLVEPMRGRNSIFNNLFARHSFERYWQPRLASPFPTDRDVNCKLDMAYTLDESRDALLRTGFRSVEVFFEWYGTCGLVAMK